MSSLDEKTILVTGGTGSFGQKFVEMALSEHNPRSIRIFSRGEYAQWDMGQRFRDPRLRFLIGDVRDKERLSRAMNGVDLVVHAAALKQIALGEYNPLEVIKTNVMGSANVVDAAIDNNVEKAIFISSDKAVNPVNLYGATKLCAERLFTHANVYVGEQRRTKFSCVRYGNVVASRGSVIPLFLEQRKNGKITITDERMTRFWITLEQGVRFVIECLEWMQGGEVFVPKIPSMRIMDLVQVVAPQNAIEFIGIRPGEKIHEVLLSTEEGRHTKEFELYFVVEPEVSLEKAEYWNRGNSVPEDFVYSSDRNSRWLSTQEMEEILQGMNNGA
ncbi:MAG: UDP-N-acetylglucosamine 4,6-dehydratase (inverting) [Patescibacteria group bacterium]